MTGLAPVLTPHGVLVLRRADDEASADPARAARLEARFARGTGYGLLSLGADEVGAVLPPLLTYWRDLATRYITAVCALPYAPWQVSPSRHRKLLSIAEPLPETLELVLANEIYVVKQALPPALRNQLLRLASFHNPEFYRAQAMRLPVYDEPRIISCAEDHPSHISLPRGCLEDAQRLCTDLKIFCNRARRAVRRAAGWADAK